MACTLLWVSPFSPVLQTPFIRVFEGASALLFLSSAPRAAKGPVPAMLTVTSALAGSYYGKSVYNLRA